MTTRARQAVSASERALARFHDALLSIYLYNEHRGYTKLFALETAVRAVRATDAGLAQAIANHARDEVRHYRMFRAWFVRRGVMPLRVGEGAGYVDRLARSLTGESLDAADLSAAAADDEAFARLCRLIVLTERRGLRQVRFLLRFPPVAADAELRAMFEVIERDEPSHFEPYESWLVRRRGSARVPLSERLADLATHLAIVGVGLPRLALDPRVPRLDAFPA